jgi:hypothetical protein
MSYMLLTVLLHLILFAAPAPDDAFFLGRWDMTVTTARGEQRASWLEVNRDGDAVKARMVGTGGGVAPVPEVAIEKGELVFKTYSNNAGVRIATVYRATPDGAGLKGTLTFGTTDPRPWTAVRGPDWKTPKNAAASKKLGKSVELFDGKGLSGWNPQNTSEPLGWIVKDGALDNQGKANNIYSTQKFTDFKVEAEYAVGKDGNSGVYLRGRYEVQVLDDYGKPPEAHSHGSLYSFITPRVNASKPAGEWQKMEATIVGNRVTVILNGEKLFEDQEIPGCTGGALDSHESEPGPILLQGDHAGIKYRKVTVTPLL